MASLSALESKLRHLRYLSCNRFRLRPNSCHRLQILAQNEKSGWFQYQPSGRIVSRGMTKVL
jgi:hypothetical protein